MSYTLTLPQMIEAMRKCAAHFPHQVPNRCAMTADAMEKLMNQVQITSPQAVTAETMKLYARIAELEQSHVLLLGLADAVRNHHEWLATAKEPGCSTLELGQWIAESSRRSKAVECALAAIAATRGG